MRLLQRRITRTRTRRIPSRLPPPALRCNSDPEGSLSLESEALRLAYTLVHVDGRLPSCQTMLGRSKRCRKRIAAVPSKRAIRLRKEGLLWVGDRGLPVPNTG
jgi:hypothetical protein